MSSARLSRLTHRPNDPTIRNVQELSLGKSLTSLYIWESMLANKVSCIYHQSPWSFMAAATLLKPAMLLPATKLGYSPSAGVT